MLDLGHDAIPSEYDIIKFEKQSGVKLPEKYREFLLKYGGGFFGYTNIYSLDEKSSFYILKNNQVPLGNILHVADNRCGDYYSFKVVGGICQDALVFYDHEIGSVSDTRFLDIFEYLVKIGLEM